MDENTIKHALELLQKAKTILDVAASEEPTSDVDAITMVGDDLDKVIDTVGDLAAE